MIVTRSQAIAAGLTRYFTGKPCPNGHVAERFVSAYTCAECAAMHKAKYRIDPDFHAKEMEYKAAYRDANREKISAYSRKKWATDPEAKAKNKKYKERSADKIRSYNSEYWAKNKDALKERGKRYCKENLEYFRAKGHERRARQACGGTHSKDDVADIMAMQRNRCAYCKADISSSYEVDHIVPLVKGGSNKRSNLQCLCASCNRRKSAKDPVVWARQIGLLI